MARTLKRMIGLLMLMGMLLIGPLAATSVLVNSQNYEDVVAGAVYAAANNYSLAFAIDASQAVFITRYYTTVKAEPVIYLEGSSSVLPNMASLLRETGLRNLTVVSGTPIPAWVADQFPKKQAILVGGGYGQDALSLAPYAALTRSPIFFIDDAGKPDAQLEAVRSRGYASVLIYGSLAHQLGAEPLKKLTNARVIDTGSRYSNNMQIVSEFVAIRPTRQAMFVSGHSLEKSMVDANYPIILVGRSSVPDDLADFIKGANITSGVVFSGDSEDTTQGSSIVDGMARLRALDPELAVFIKFGEGYSGVSQALPLMVMTLPSPQVSLSVLNLTYNIGSKTFELRVANTGDYIFLTSGVFVNKVGSAESSQISLAPNQTTTIGIPLDAAGAIESSQIPSADITVNYGEDTHLLDNVDVISFVNIPISSYVDNSSLRLVGVTYSSEKKAFQLQLEGDGWASGTLRFTLGQRAVSLDLPTQEIHGAGVIEVKYLLSSDEENYLNGLAVDYFLRTGARSDILLREKRGQSPVAVSRPVVISSGDTSGTDGAAGQPWLLACAGVGLLLAAIVGVRYYLSRQDGF